MVKNYFDRDVFIKRIEEVSEWDMVIIGGGATGLGIAIDGASRGFRVLLLEKVDFAKGTSSRSTKLVHGGVRYLEQGNIQLVKEALKERGILLQNAPHLVHKLAFLIPCYSTFSKLKYLLGLKLYDWLSGSLSFGKSSLLSAKEAIQKLPSLKTKGLKGGIQYYDGQFDDARLAINLAQTAAEQEATLINYMPVQGFIKDDTGKITGVQALDLESGKLFSIHSKVVINATGVFVDDVLKLDNPSHQVLVQPSQGVHIVLDKTFLPGEEALMIPKTSDGRVLFALPWHEHLLVGTTDTPLPSHSLEPVPLEKEIEFLLQTTGIYLTKEPTRKDILSVFAGLRPLAAPKKETSKTKEISRSHKLLEDKSGLITITGGKWTTYRKMAEETVDLALLSSKQPLRRCTTQNLKIHGATTTLSKSARSYYGADEAKLLQLEAENPEWAIPFLENHPYTPSQVIWAARFEMARTVEDVLARRIRILFLDARIARQLAEETARLLAQELGRSPEWEKSQVAQFLSISTHYTLT